MAGAGLAPVALGPVGHRLEGMEIGDGELVAVDLSAYSEMNPGTEFSKRSLSVLPLP